MAKHSPPSAGQESSTNKPTETAAESTSDVKVNGNHLTTSSDPAAEASATSVEAVKDLLIDQLATSSSSLS